MSLNIKHLPSDDWNKPAKWELLNDYQIMGYSIPKGFITDGVSVPRILYSLYNPTGKALRAAILHDYLLSLLHSTESRCTADKVFRDALLYSGVKPLRAQIMYLFVRMYGVIRIALIKSRS